MPLYLWIESPTHFQIVEEEVVVGWRTVQKARVSVAAKWKVRPVKLQAVRAHHNFRPSSGRFVLGKFLRHVILRLFCSDSDEESVASDASGPSSAVSADDVSSLSEPGVEDDSDEDVIPSSSSENASSDVDSDTEDNGTRAASAAAPCKSGSVGKARGDSEILEVLLRILCHRQCFIAGYP